MDIISFNEAATANGRIEKVIAQPDSVSGLVTMPSVVATGEVISIPTGRTVVHPNLQVDGTLDVQGTLFIPSGGSVSTTEVDATVVKQNGNVVANDSTVVHKTGNETIAGVKTFSNNTVMNGYVGFGVTSPQARISLGGYSIESISWQSATNVNKWYIGAHISDAANDGLHIGVGNNVDGTRHLHIHPTGGVLVTQPTGLGYGTGSGGTVTQLTSKGTAVTLNKPCGRIIMNGDSLAAGATVQFYITNTKITDGDGLLVNPMYGIEYQAWCSACYNNTALISVKNISAGARAEAVTLIFAIIKGRVN